jgi:hypothetical protein
VLTEPGLARRMAEETARLAPSLLWPAVAEQYRSLADTLVTTARPRTTAAPPTIAGPPVVPATARLTARAPVSR